jgi:hypothetical protein
MIDCLSWLAEVNAARTGRVTAVRVLAFSSLKAANPFKICFIKGK